MTLDLTAPPRIGRATPLWDALLTERAPGLAAAADDVVAAEAATLAAMGTAP